MSPSFLVKLFKTCVLQNFSQRSGRNLLTCMIAQLESFTSPWTVPQWMSGLLRTGIYASDFLQPFDKFSVLHIPSPQSHYKGRKIPTICKIILK